MLYQPIPTTSGQKLNPMWIAIETSNQVPDPELDIRGWGRSSRLLDKGRARSPKKFFFGSSGHSLVLKLGGLGPLSWFRHCLGSISAALSRSSPRRDYSGEERELISRTATGIWANLYPKHLETRKSFESLRACEMEFISADF